ncbi:hypothetical protein HF521_016920 [Silurus meridionalis]|uniref:Little elongation complex subunit 1 C-terminal domain-containing protein n=1 Tax=Silurus meridionalis TaxID=175797 RepID=A0A8T0BNJ2_SILME|nr:hypothetical protein HF521_016920 [Silurus meridionalis]
MDREELTGSLRGREELTGSLRGREELTGSLRDREELTGSLRDREELAGSLRDKEELSRRSWDGTELSRRSWDRTELSRGSWDRTELSVGSWTLGGTESSRDSGAEGEFPEVLWRDRAVLDGLESAVIPGEPEMERTSLEGLKQAETSWKLWAEQRSRGQGNIHNAITSTLKSFLEDSSLRFLENSWYGFNLCPATWNYIFSLDLLCAQLGWTWTITNIIWKDLWLILNTWLRQARTEQTPFRDVCVAAVFRLLGRLGQLGLKENMLTSLENLARSINQFGMQSFSKGMPWEVQLSVIYAIHDLAPSNPEAALKTLESWKKNSTQRVPSAVNKCITQISFLCHQTESQRSQR